MKVIFVISTGVVIPALLSPLLPTPDNHMCKFDNNIDRTGLTLYIACS